MNGNEIYNGSQWAHDIFLVHKAGATEYITSRSSTLFLKIYTRFKFDEEQISYSRDRSKNNFMNAPKDSLHFKATIQNSNNDKSIITLYFRETVCHKFSGFCTNNTDFCITASKLFRRTSYYEPKKYVSCLM